MYGSVAGGDTYFALRLHTFDWDQASNSDKEKALNAAADLIDQFDYAGQKYAVHQVGNRSDYASQEAYESAIQAANASQPHEFPRGSVNTVPVDIEHAAYLIAKALLSGRDPELDLETATNKNSRFGDLATSTDVEGNTMEHIAHLIPSPKAWNLIRPYLRSGTGFLHKRG